MRTPAINKMDVLAFATAIFAGAFLLFEVQPMIGKYLLPWFGGSPEVWTTCMLFFQVLLLAGYLYAHLSCRYLPLPWQGAVHVALLAAAAALLPLNPEAHWPGQAGSAPTGQVLLLLTRTLGLPFLALAATSPLIQSWFAVSQGGKSPYRLYALSNAGSLLALVSYPLAVEPYLTRHQQTAVWSWAWVGFAAVCAACAAIAWRGARRRRDQEGPAVPQSAIGNRQSAIRGAWAFWLALPAASSLVLLAATNKICLDLAVVPFLWVLPLCLYLLTYIVCFAGARWYARRVWTALFMVSLAGCVWLRSHETTTPVVWQIAVYLAALLGGCMTAHGELYRLRPEADRLTAYYLAIAAGGAVGGLLAAVVAPLVFKTYLDLYLGLAAICLLIVLADPTGTIGRRRWIWAGTIVAVMATAGVMEAGSGSGKGQVVLRTRNFYGVLTLWENPSDETARRHFTLQHGTTFHGLQFAEGPLRRQPTAYYGRTSGAGLAMQCLPADRPRRVGVVGLGVGTLAAYGRQGDVYRFYEINPAVTELARTRFSYLADSPATIEIVPGDARNSLQHESPQQFDLLALDAFSSDAIPVHLLTREAFALYLSHLRAGGVLAIHVSTQHLDLQSVVARLASHFGLHLAWIESPANPALGVYDSDWMLLTASPDFLAAPPVRDAASDAHPLRPDVPLWTDERVSLLDVLKLN